MNLLERPRGRRALFALLYFCEGAPIGFVWWALPAVLREGGASQREIGALLSILALPWALKVVWAPLVDVLRVPRFGERGWILASQLAMVLSLLPLIGRDLAASMPLLYAALLVHAFAAATQDVAIDALAVRSTPEHERGSVNGWMNAGMMLGRSLFAGGALGVRARYGDDAVLIALVATLAAAMGLGFLYRSTPPTVERGALRRFGRHLATALGRRGTWVGLGFALIAGAGYEGLGSMTGALLIDRDAGSVSFFGLVAPACIVTGGLVGGRLSDRVGRRAALAVFTVLMSAGVGLVAWLARDGAPGGNLALLAGLAATYFAIGLFTAASYALFMDLTDPALGSTQFSAYMGATNLCESWSARAAGELAVGRGYATAFSSLAAVSLLSVLLLPALPARERPEDREGAASD